jgi:hypothetical protein
MTPSRHAFDAARLRTAIGVTALAWGVLTYDGQEYEASVVLDGETFESGDLGRKRVQRLTASIRKTAMLDRPVDGKMVIYEGRAYEIARVDGDHTGLPDWEIEAFRVPGGDA